MILYFNLCSLYKYRFVIQDFFDSYEDCFENSSKLFHNKTHKIFFDVFSKLTHLKPAVIPTRGRKASFHSRKSQIGMKIMAWGRTTNVWHVKRMWWLLSRGTCVVTRNVHLIYFRYSWEFLKFKSSSKMQSNKYSIPNLWMSYTDRK